MSIDELGEGRCVQLEQQIPGQVLEHVARRATGVGVRSAPR